MGIFDGGMSLNPGASQNPRCLWNKGAIESGVLVPNWLDNIPVFHTYPPTPRFFLTNYTSSPSQWKERLYKDGSVSPGIEPGYIVFPSTNDNVQIIYWAYCYRVKIKKISSSAPGLSVMTLHECHVDRPFPVTWLGNVWEPAPPHIQVQADYFTLAFQA
jgi:hypothetical protein